jgi:hypothetical protein
MRFTRQPSGRTDFVRRRVVSGPEILETRQVLSHALPNYLSPWLPTDLHVSNPITHQPILLNVEQLYNPLNVSSPLMDNAGKIVSGTDRAGNKWVITVHGPGEVIVTDTTPNDGVLDDDINTIQLVGTNPRKTYVTGSVTASALTVTNGTVLFNQLIDTSGVKSIILNGFVLSAGITPPVTTPTGVFLYGGVQVLSFQDIEATIDTSVSTTPYQVVIGSPSTPLKVAPSIYLNDVSNFVFNSEATTIPTTPLTTPTVQFIINGVLHNFRVVAATRGNIPTNVVDVLPGESTAAYNAVFPVVGTTGRTAVQATGVDTVHVPGSVKNFTLSKSAQPFQNAASGLDFLRKARFGGNVDGLGIDVNGKIGKLEFRRGLGDPTGVFTAKTTSGQLLPATQYGIPEGTTGYPASGFLGAAIRATQIDSLAVGPASTLVTTPQNPQYVQFRQLGWPTYSTAPGYSLTNAAVTSSGNINQVHVVGTQLNSEIKTGFDYPSYVAGLQGTRARSRIGRLQQRGDLINSVISASFRPANNHYSDATGTAGPGTIVGSVQGVAYDTGGTTALGNTGAGVFARTIKRLHRHR